MARLNMLTVQYCGVSLNLLTFHFNFAALVYSKGTVKVQGCIGNWFGHFGYRVFEVHPAMLVVMYLLVFHVNSKQVSQIARYLHIEKII